MVGRRQKIIVANWKMYKNISDTQAFIARLLQTAQKTQNQIYIAPPFTAIPAASLAAKGSSIVIGAQNMHDAKEGAYTGEISASMLQDAGARFVILGHSERRYIFGEGNQFINRKVKQALSVGLQPILCVGETEHDRMKGVAADVLADQLLYCLEDVNDAILNNLILAYEPVWAIGTGKTASPEQAQEMHFFCREFLKKQRGKEIADTIPILYGGSVKPDNIQALLEQPDVDGALVGGASLAVDSFAQLVN